MRFRREKGRKRDRKRIEKGTEKGRKKDRKRTEKG
jgi:hypothetical protein